eukprot:168892_1
MSSKQTRTRIMSEIKFMQKNPPDGITAAPLEQNLFEWHFTIKGADDTEFEGGRYHGKFILPATYPMKAPDVVMYTKSGRFEVGKKICLNFTGYHHELWQPAWTICTMLTALRAFMETKAQGVGAISVDKHQRIRYAKQSLNYQCPKCGVKMRDIVFPKNNNKTKKDKDKQNKNDDDIIQITNDNDTENNNDKEIEQNEINNDNEIEQNDNDNSNENENENENKQNDESDEKTDENDESQTAAPSRKNRMLDNFTVILVIIIIGILFKKICFEIH